MVNRYVRWEFTESREGYSHRRYESIHGENVGASENKVSIDENKDDHSSKKDSENHNSKNHGTKSKSNSNVRDNTI